MSCPKQINENSPLALNSALNIFSVPPTNVSVIRSFFREILPLSTITQDSPYLFRLFSDNLWTDLSRTYLYLELSIEKLGDTGKWEDIDSTKDTNIGTIQGIGQTFVQQLKVNVGNTEVDMYEALGMANSDRSIDIPMSRFKNGWTFFVIPLTSTLDDSCGFELLRSGTTSIRLEFNSPIPSGGVEMIILGEFDQMLMIDYNRHIVSDSNLG
uniref:Uncharacterized protein n=1 Tax=Meloidogyne enterolobii TaxID=390850 RepID=A0A6V7XKL9_MELEN|nr:unnamed protein product [Meloidogyne enterolobii]